MAELMTLTTGAMLKEIARGYSSTRRAELRFWFSVDFSEECWIWQGTRNRNGYGHFNHSGPMGVLAHRIAWTYTRGSPGVLHVLHTCDTPACVRPNHLYLGTHTENMQDKVRKGRQFAASRQGSANKISKLHEADVILMRARWESGAHTMTSLAASYGVSIKTVSQIVRRKAWIHV